MQPAQFTSPKIVATDRRLQTPLASAEQAAALPPASPAAAAGPWAGAGPGAGSGLGGAPAASRGLSHLPRPRHEGLRSRGRRGGTPRGRGGGRWAERVGAAGRFAKPGHGFEP